VGENFILVWSGLTPILPFTYFWKSDHLDNIASSYLKFISVSYIYHTSKNCYAYLDVSGNMSSNIPLS
jgi:hypothetical protein